MNVFDNLVKFFGTAEDDFRAEWLEAGKKGFLIFNQAEVRFNSDFSREPEVIIPADTIANVEISSDVQESSRVTFTRLFFMNIYALAFPKRISQEDVYVSVDTTSGETYSFLLKQASYSAAAKKISKYKNYYS